jgi:hypothetical protein
LDGLWVGTGGGKMSEPTLAEIEERWRSGKEGENDRYWLIQRVKELEACRRVDRDTVEHLAGKVNELIKGIRNHKLNMWGSGKVQHPLDETLYKLIEGGGDAKNGDKERRVGP